MSNLEHELKSALGRKAPSGDFAARVLRRLHEPEPRPWREQLMGLLRPPRLQWVAASLTIALLVPFAAVQYRQQREMRLQGEAAKEQLILAMRIAGTELRHAQQKIQKVGRVENQ